MTFYTWIVHTLTALAWCVSTFEEDAFLPDQAKLGFSFATDSQKDVSIY